ncbi:MAG: class I SAM-dependent methyltransferase [Acidobacteriota bacterium]
MMSRDKDDPSGSGRFRQFPKTHATLSVAVAVVSATWVRVHLIPRELEFLGTAGLLAVIVGFALAWAFQKSLQEQIKPCIAATSFFLVLLVVLQLRFIEQIPATALSPHTLVTTIYSVSYLLFLLGFVLTIGDRDILDYARRALSVLIKVAAKNLGVGRSSAASDLAFQHNQSTYHRAEEDRFQQIAEEASALNKPFSDLNVAPFHLYRLGLAFAALNLGPRDEILDFGAGTCWLSAMLNRMGLKTVSLDISATALEIGRKNFSLDKRQRLDLQPEFRTYDGHLLPFDDGRFDAIISFDAFHHLPNQAELLREMYRVLNEAGRVVFCEPLGGHSDSRTSRIEVESYGVLERDIDLSELKREAFEIGFEQLVLKPYSPTPDDELVKDSLATNLRFYTEQAFLRYLNKLGVFYLKKTAAEVYDSNHPHKLEAQIDLVPSRVECPPGMKLKITVGVINSGDTLWLARHHPQGGHVALGCQLLDAEKKLLDRNFRRFNLPSDMPPGDAYSEEIEVASPGETGIYYLKFDLVDENVCWFEEAGSDPIHLELVVTHP